MVDKNFGYAFDLQRGEKVLLVCPFSSDQKKWFDLECVNVHSGMKYRMVDYAKRRKSAVQRRLSDAVCSPRNPVPGTPRGEEPCT